MKKIMIREVGIFCDRERRKPMKANRNLKARRSHPGAAICLTLAMCVAPECSAFQAGPSPGSTGEALSAPRRHEEAFPGRTGERRKGLFETPSGIVELEYEVIDGQSIFQGDIRLPADEEKPGGKESRTAAGVSALGQRWPHGIVYVEDSGLARDARVIGAMREWANKTSLRFVVAPTTGNRIQFVIGPVANECSSPVGMQKGAQIVYLGSNCDTGGAIHEIGHAIGLFHEQSRRDRGDFVIVNDGTKGTTNCILPDKRHNFEMFGTNGLNLGAYDFDSIMHYPSDAWLDTSAEAVQRGCKATITRRDGTSFNASRALSRGDIAGAQSLYLAWTMVRKPQSYTLLGNSDAAAAVPQVWRPSTGAWFRIGARQTPRWGAPTDIPVPGDYDGDSKEDIAVWRPSTGRWEWIASSSSVGWWYATQWGEAGDVPVPGDYNGDGRTDFAVWRPATGQWFVAYGTGQPSLLRQWGEAGDVPVPGDYDGDGRPDLAVWRRSTGQWLVIESRTGTPSSHVTLWGAADDVPVPGDYDGDGKTDFAVWRPSTGRWEWIASSSPVGWWYGTEWGLADDVPVPADYDGDGKTDLAVWRPSTGTWWVIKSRTGISYGTQWGTRGDVPLPSATVQLGVAKPAAPTGLTATAASASQINLTWTDASSNETGFKIERSSGGSAFAQTATVGAGVTFYASTGLTAGTAYSYRVRANNAQGDSGYSNTATATTQATPPATPARFRGTPNYTGSSLVHIRLYWSDVANETSYRLEGCKTASLTATCTYALVKVLPANSDGLIDTSVSVTWRGFYKYRVRADNAAGSSAWAETTVDAP